VTRDVLHDDKDALVVGNGVVHADDVRVVQGGTDLGLALEAPADVLGAVRVQPLDGDVAQSFARKTVAIPPAPRRFSIR
jgi:transketolase C-terminal domain/subunit